MQRISVGGSGGATCGCNDRNTDNSDDETTENTTYISKLLNHANRRKREVLYLQILPDYLVKYVNGL